MGDQPVPGKCFAWGGGLPVEKQLDQDCTVRSGGGQSLQFVCRLWDDKSVVGEM